MIVVTVAISAASAGALLLAAVVFGAVCLCLGLLLSERYELTLAVLMLYLGLLDGYLKLKLNTSWATLGRDALLYAIVIGAVVRAAVRRRRIEIPPLTGWVFAFAAVVLIQVFNPANGSWSYAVASVRPHLEFVPLFFLGYWTMRSKTRLRGFLSLLLLVAAINGMVSFVQFNMTTEEFANWGPGYSERIYGTNTVSGRSFADSNGILHNRPFGLGGDAGFGGVVAMLAVPAALALVLARARARLLLVSLTLLLAAGAVVGVITSQARAAVVMSVLAALAFGMLASVSRRVVGTLAALTVAVAVALATVSVVTDSAQSPFRKYTTIAPNRVLTTTYNYRADTLATVPKYAKAFPLGAGIGSAGPAAGYGGKIRGRALNAESEPTFLLIELGIPGLLVLLGLNLKLFALTLRRTHRLPDVELRLLLAAVLAPLFALFAGWIVGISSASSPSSPYFWFVAGIAAYWLTGRTGQHETATLTTPAPGHNDARDVSSRTKLSSVATVAAAPSQTLTLRAPLTTERAAPTKTPRGPVAVPGAPTTGPPRAPSVRIETMGISLLYRDPGRPVDGIRDYSRGLCASLSAAGADASLDLFDGRELPTEATHSDAIVVQYNPFSYGRFGFAPWLPRALRRMRKRPSRPIIAVMVHESYFPMSGLRGILMGSWQRVQLAAVRLAADVTFVSIEPWVRPVRRWGPDGPVHHVPVGSALPDMRSHRLTARAELGVSPQTIVVATFGTGHPDRIMRHIGASVRALQEAGHSVVLLNLGANAPVPEGIPDSVPVEAPGYLEPAAVACKLSAADLFIAPFIGGVSSRRTTFVAALQHGLPIVATHGRLTDGFIRDATDACRLFPVDDPERLTRAVVELAGRPAERERLGHGARLLYEREFAWPVIADRILGHLREAFVAQLRDARSKSTH